ncbi:multicomponent Na+:H+ antiporter subunit F [Mumia flava]|uniref:Multicomponent Na+:H+ antiporter subunit F n=1 Tax=Mumia flava TaxID=1348852 RepID=A0A2M9BGY2_9ACTN|nr:monovalent cation/H+ antiporter complex subunit F [Mumia flava]PJJ57217.1 multicomponent Na+:H+ antiporter subunit F [Mumia flava]
MSVTLVAVWVAGVMLAIAALLCVVRTAIGPTMANRAIAVDTLVAVLVCALGLEAAYNRHTDTLPILVVLSLVGVVGSVSIARFAVADDDEMAEESGETAEGASDEPR